MKLYLKWRNTFNNTLLKLFCFLSFLPMPAWATTTNTGLQWETTSQSLSESITGPFLLYTSMGLFVAGFLMLVMSEWGEIMKFVIKALFVLAGCFGVLGIVKICGSSGAVF